MATTEKSAPTSAKWSLASKIRLSIRKRSNPKSSGEQQSSLGENAGASCCVITAVNEAIGGGAETAGSASGAKIGNGLIHVPHGAHAIAGTVAPAFLALGGTIGSIWNATRNRALRKDLDSIVDDIEAIEKEGLHKADQVEIARELAKERREAAKFMERTAGWRAAAVSGAIALSAVPGLAILAPIGLFGSAVNAVSHGRREWKQWKKARNATRVIKAELREMHEYAVDESRKNAKIRGPKRFFSRYIQNHAYASSNVLREKILPMLGLTVAPYTPEPPLEFDKRQKIGGESSKGQFIGAGNGIFLAQDRLVNASGKVILENVRLGKEGRLTDKDGFFLGYVSQKTDRRIHRGGQWANEENLREGAALREWLRHYQKERKLRLKNMACWTAYGVGSAALGVFTTTGLVAATIASHGVAVPAVIASLKVVMLGMGCAGMAVGIGGALRYNSRLNGPKYTPSFPKSMSDLVRLKGKGARERIRQANNENEKAVASQGSMQKNLIHETEMSNLVKDTVMARENIEKTRAYRRDAVIGMKMSRRWIYRLGTFALETAPILTLGIFSQTCATWQRRWKEKSVSWFGARDQKLLETLDMPMVEFEVNTDDSKGKSILKDQNKTQISGGDFDFHKSFSSWIRSDTMKKTGMMAYDGIGNLLAKRTLSENWFTGKKTMPERYSGVFLHPDDKRKKIVFNPGNELSQGEYKKATKQFQKDMTTLDSLQGCCYGKSIGKGVLEDMLDVDENRENEQGSLPDTGLLQNSAIQYAAFSRENVSREKLARIAQMGVIRLRHEQKERKSEQARSQEQSAEQHTFPISSSSIQAWVASRGEWKPFQRKGFTTGRVVFRDGGRQGAVQYILDQHAPDKMTMIYYPYHILESRLGELLPLHGKLVRIEHDGHGGVSKMPELAANRRCGEGLERDASISSMRVR